MQKEITAKNNNNNNNNINNATVNNNIAALPIAIGENIGKTFTVNHKMAAAG